jgi:hypothetical protein
MGERNFAFFLSFFVKAADKYPYFPGQEPTLPGHVDFLLEVCLLCNLFMFISLYFMLYSMMLWGISLDLLERFWKFTVFGHELIISLPYLAEYLLSVYVSFYPQCMKEAGVDGALIVQPINHKFDHSLVTRYVETYNVFSYVLDFVLTSLYVTVTHSALEKVKSHMIFFFLAWPKHLMRSIRASPTIIVKVAIEKIQLSILATVFSIFSPTDSLLYFQLAFKYYFSLFFYYIFVNTQWKEKYWISTHSLSYTVQALRQFNILAKLHFMKYEAYKPMAIRCIKSICSSARSYWSLHSIAAAHHLGPVPVGVTSVFIAISAVHRADALDACKFVVDELKASVFNMEEGSLC